jgi:ABC-2 type transport system permease protein
MTMKKVVKDAFIIAWMKSIPDLKRQPLIIVLLTALSAIPLFFIVLFGGGGMINAGLVGVIVSSIGFIGISASIQDLTWDRYVKMREMVVAMPVSSISYSVGIALGFLIFSLPGFILFMCLGVYRGLFDIVGLLATLGAIVLCWMGLAVIGFTIATYQYKASPNTLGIIANLLSFLFVFLPPVYYPKEMLAQYGAEWVAYIIPTSNAAEIIRYVTGLTTWDATSYMYHWIALIITVVIFTILVVKKARWREP